MTVEPFTGFGSNLDGGFCVAVGFLACALFILIMQGSEGKSAKVFFAVLLILYLHPSK